LIGEKFAATEACRDVVMARLPAVFGALTDVLVLARDELGFPLDKHLYVQLMTEHNSRMASVVDDLLSEVRRKVSHME
jgi:hypothetical protein